MTSPRNIYLNRDWLFRRILTKYDATTRTDIALTGATVSGYLSLTEVPGSALAGTTTTLTESGSSGDYSGVLDAAAVTSALTAYLNQRIYEIVTITGDYQDAVLLRVRRIEVLD
jgi:hypothetical protein